MGTPTKGIRGSLPNPHKAAILEDAKARMMQGETLHQIAARHGISRQALWVWLNNMGDEYKQLRDLYIDTRLFEADEELDCAADQLSLARAREKIRSAQWYAERRDRARYGQQQQLSDSGPVQVVINLGSISDPKVVESD